MPKTIQDAPILDFGNDLYFVAFNDLASCRYFAEGLIPWTAINDYAEANGIEGEQRRRLIEVIREVDIWYIERRAKEEKKAGKRGTKRTSGPDATDSQRHKPRR